MEIHEARLQMNNALDALRVAAEECEARAKAAEVRLDSVQGEIAKLDATLKKKREAEAAYEKIVAQTSEAESKAKQTQAHYQKLIGMIKSLQSLTEE
jgi:hypothetical protein